jgi:hypothetical protein
MSELKIVMIGAGILPHGERTARVTDTIVRAGLARRRRLVHEAIELDPTALDKAAGLRATDACLEAHEDVLGRFQ